MKNSKKKKSVEGYERGDNVAAPFVLAFVIRHFFLTHTYTQTRKKKKRKEGTESTTSKSHIRFRNGEKPVNTLLVEKRKS